MTRSDEGEGFIVNQNQSEEDKDEEEDDFFFEDEKQASADANTDKEETESNSNEIIETQTGYAAWYGKELHGRPTASGEIFNMNQNTAAHPTFPIDSTVVVKNLDNGKKSMVRINDRGPYVEGRVLDVSYAVAKELEFVEIGVAKVQVELIKKGDFSFLSRVDTPSGRRNKQRNKSENGVLSNARDFFFADGLKPEGYTIQVGAFKRRSNAEKYRDDLEERFNRRIFIANKGKWHFVWVGDFKNSGKARSFRSELNSEGLETIFRSKLE